MFENNAVLERPNTQAPSEPKQRVIFDAGYVDYLANNLTERQLIQELRDRRISKARFIAREFPSCAHWSEFAYWLDYASAIESALLLRRWATVVKPAPEKISQIDVERVKSEVDIVSVIDQYAPLKKAGRNFKGVCPLHADTEPSLTVYPYQQSWHCYGCNAGGDVISFIMKAENKDFKEALSQLMGSPA